MLNRYNNVYRVVALLSLGTFFFVPLAALAQNSPFTNPLGTTDINTIFQGIIRWLLGIVGFLALLALVWGGVRIIAGFGNEQQVADGKKVVFWAVIGLSVVILASAILRIVGSTLGLEQ